MSRPTPSPEPFTVSPGAGLDLQGEEEGRGRALVLAHGLTATRRYVLQGSRALSRSGGLRVISYDARGHGESSPAPDGVYGYPALARDLGAVLDERAIEKAVIAGSSMGAAAAIAFCLEHPDRVEALVQITPAYDGQPRSTAGTLEAWDARAEALDAGDVDSFVTLTGVDSLPPRFRVAARLAVRQRIERHRDLSAVAEAVRQVPRSAAFDGLDRLSEIAVPVLVVASGDEADPEHPFAVAGEYARRLPDARLVTEEKGDPPLAWQGTRLSHAIAAFLDDHRP
ncbi:MAG: alpha/beta fold hydrolase [Thermoleophilaceae bacterium]